MEKNGNNDRNKDKSKDSNKTGAYSKSNDRNKSSKYTGSGDKSSKYTSSGDKSTKHTGSGDKSKEKTFSHNKKTDFVKSNKRNTYEPSVDDQDHTAILDEDSDETTETTETSLIIEGRNAVNEALRADRSFDRLFIQDQISVEGPIKVIIAKAREKGIVVRFETKEGMDRRSVGHHHQGVIGYVAAYDYVSIDDMLAKAEEKGEAPFLVVLDGIEDPHNLGAIIRTANITGVHGIIIPKRRACGLTETVVKTSAGAIEYTPVCKVTNISQTLELLKSKGLWIAGADMEGTMMYDVDLKGALALVIGGEGSGLSKLVGEKCDFIAKIPMQGDIDSLNASVASGVLMYEALRQRNYK
jgi:23S rRNA (guanosine2251-2'-O)-methyltransferase